MYRYFIVVWNPADPAEVRGAMSIRASLAQAAPKWRSVFESRTSAAYDCGAEELGRTDTTWQLAGGAGAIFGRVFTRDSTGFPGAIAPRFTEAESRAVAASGGCSLLQRYWGRYIAVIHDLRARTVAIIRDPTGGLPCLLVRCQGVYVILSDLEDLLRLGMHRPAVNWNYIRRFVASASLQCRETGLCDVEEILPGERVQFSAQGLSRSMEWSPLAIAAVNPISDPQEAVAQLQATVRASVHVWVAGHSSLVHNLSGGLDSSIVLSCLRDAPSRPAITCLHYYGVGPGEDERRYARAMAQHVEVELVEHRLDAREVDLRRLDSLRASARPWFYLYELEHGRFEAQIARQQAATALTSGGGGDGVFYQGHAEAAVADCLIVHGLSRELARTAIDAGRICGQSVWALLWQAARARLRGGHDPNVLSDVGPAPFVRAGLTERAHEADRPAWLTEEAMRAAPPGKLRHALSVNGAPAFYSSFPAEPYPDHILPLLSQPLVELCLRIPTWVLIGGGVDRSIARRAFAAALPPLIVGRRGKGRADRHLRDVLDVNLPDVRERLLRGWLVRAGLLDRSALENYLAPGRSPRDFHYLSLLQHHLCTEAWLASWLGS